MVSRVIAIVETSCGWEVDGTLFPSAAAALRWVKEGDAERAKLDGIAATTIEWQPITKIGRQVVLALQ